MNKVSRGRFYEKRAIEYLKLKGVEILEKNYYGKSGEIDIIGMENETLIFVEVKYRRDKRYGTPLEAIDSKKIKKIYQTAIEYLEKREYDRRAIRFDAITVLGDTIEWVKNIVFGDELC